MKGKKRKREFVEINGYLVFEHHAFFNDYIEAEIGAKWGLIKRTLFDAGYTAAEVSEYRDRLLKDFDEFCRKYSFVKII